MTAPIPARLCGDGMPYDKESFLAGVAAGRNMESWPAFETDQFDDYFALTIDVNEYREGTIGIDTYTNRLPGVNGGYEPYPSWSETGPHPFTIWWGDGTYNHYEDWRYIRGIQHVYPAAGRYTIVYWGYVEGISLHLRDTDKLIKFNTPLTVPISLLNRTFTDMEFLESIDYKAFEWYARNSAKYGLYIPSGMFDGSTIRVVSGDLFRGVKIVDHPTSGNPSSIDNMFLDCKALTTVGESLFSNRYFKENITSAVGVFEGCENLKSVPNGIFSGMNELVDFRRCFYECDNLEYAIPLWEMYPDADGRSCFGGCYNASNYEDIPNEWK